MATTTPNYGWDVPTSTDYVKDGATAIETLGDDIDASLFSITSGKNVGLVHIATQTFSGATAVNVDAAFTSAFANYRVDINFTGSAVSYQALGFNYRNAGSTITSSFYVCNIAGVREDGTTISIAASAAANAFMTGHYTPGATVASLTFFNPLANTPTSTLVSHQYQSSTAQLVFGAGGIYHGTNQVVDGFRFTCANAMTGTIRIYGMRNS
jgi:hypothetical protein